MTVDEPVEGSTRRQRIEQGRAAAGLAGEDQVGRLGRLELDLAGQADELIRAGTADQGRVPEPSVFAGRPAAAGQEGDSAVAAVDRGRDLHAGVDDDLFFAVRPPKTMIRSMLPIAGCVASSWPLILTWMTAPPEADELGNLSDMNRVLSVKLGLGLDDERRADDLDRSGRDRPHLRSSRCPGLLTVVAGVVCGPVAVTWY